MSLSYTGALIALILLQAGIFGVVFYIHKSQKVLQGNQELLVKLYNKLAGEIPK